MLLLLASFMVVVPSADLSAAAGNPFLGRYQSGCDDDSPYDDKEKYEHSKWHGVHFFLRFLGRSKGKGYCANLRQRMAPRYRRASTFGTAANALDGLATPQFSKMRSDCHCHANDASARLSE